MSESPLVSLTLTFSGATHEEASATCDEWCFAHLRSRDLRPADSPPAGAAVQGSLATAVSLEPVSPLLRRYLEQHHWPPDSWRSDLVRWVRAWKSEAQQITRIIVSDFPRTASYDLVKAEAAARHQIKDRDFGGHNWSPGWGCWSGSR